MTLAVGRHGIALRNALCAGLAAVVVAAWGAPAAAAWFDFGRPRQPDAPDRLMAALLPHPEVTDRQQLQVAAPRPVVIRAIRRFRLTDSGAIRMAFATGVASFATGPLPRPEPPFLEWARQTGWSMLAQRRGAEFIYGAAAQPWRRDGVFHRLSARQFAPFLRPGYAKIAWCIAADSLGPARTLLRTETRVVTTDAASRQQFHRYWAVFSPGILLVRHEAMRTIRSEAEHR